MRSPICFSAAVACFGCFCLERAMCSRPRSATTPTVDAVRRRALVQLGDSAGPALRTIPPDASLARKRTKSRAWRKRLMIANWTEKRLKRLKLLNKEGFSATVIAGKLGPAFTKAIVLRKLHLLEAQRLERAKKRATTKAAKPRALSRASKQAQAPRKAPPAPRVQASPPVLLKAEPIRVVPPVLPAPSKPTVVQGLCLFDLREGHCRWPLGD